MADVDVELQGGIKIKLPEEQATAYLAARTKDKAEREELAKVAGSAKAEKDAEAAGRARAEAEKQAMEAAKAGELDKAKEILTRESNAKLGKLADKYRDVHLRGAVASLPSLLKLPDAKAQASLVDDIVAQLRGGCRFDMEADALAIVGQDGRPALGSDGKPVGVDAHIAQFLEARPYLRQPTQAQGSGAAGSGKSTSAHSLTASQLESMTPIEKAKLFAANPDAKVIG